MKKVLVYGMTNLTGGIENYIYNLTKEFRGVFQFDFLIHFESMAFEKRDEGKRISNILYSGERTGYPHAFESVFSFHEKTSGISGDLF